MYELFVAVKGRKHYLVFDDRKYQMEECLNEGRRYFKCGAHNLTYQYGYIYKGELYLGETDQKCVKYVKVVSHWRSA